jgi:hypothetical protein
MATMNETESNTTDQPQALDEIAAVQALIAEADVATLGRYRMTGRVGAGEFGVVLSAFDDELHRLVAIKLPHQTWSSRLDFVDNYLTEARVLGSLDYSNRC